MAVSRSMVNDVCKAAVLLQAPLNVLGEDNPVLPFSYLVISSVGKIEERNFPDFFFFFRIFIPNLALNFAPNVPRIS